MKRFLILVLILCLMGCTTLSNHTKDWRIYDSCEACEKVNTAILVLLIGLMSLVFSTPCICLVRLMPNCHDLLDLHETAGRLANT